MICTWENVRSYNRRLTWQFPFPSHEEGQGLCFQNAADPTCAYTSLQQTSFLGYKLVQSSGQTPGMLSLSSKDQHTSGLNINKAVGTFSSLSDPGTGSYGSHFPETSPGVEHPLQGQEETQGFTGWLLLACCLSATGKEKYRNKSWPWLQTHLLQLLEQHHREAVLQRGWSSSAQPRLLPELRNAARLWGHEPWSSLTSAVLPPFLQTPSRCSRWTLTWKLTFNYHNERETAILQLKHGVDKLN